VIFLTSHRGGAVWDKAYMVEKVDIAAIRNAIEVEMARKGFSRRGLSLAAGLGPTAVRDLMEKTDNPGIGTLRQVAEALDVPFESISGGAGVPLAGKIGAGGQIAYFPDDGEPQMVPRPPLAPGPLIAFEVSGDSMLPKYEPGDIIYARRDHEGVLPAYLGAYCAVGLSDGGTYLKRLTAGTELGSYTLLSLNAADMVNVQVEWAAPVLFIMPRRNPIDK
jgi:phage repressor protein C with HTH and peptisase S24 domain